MIRIVGPKEIKSILPGELVINTTSHSKDFGRNLSPFFLGPIELYDGHISKNMENAWQYAKVYKQHLSNTKEILESYWPWAKAGWQSLSAHRYPMGKGQVPEFSLWASQRLSYLEAREKIYLPLYAKAVRTTVAYHCLEDAYTRRGKITLFDFDGYDHRKLGMSLDDVLTCERRKMGHAFVLAMLLSKMI